MLPYKLTNEFGIIYFTELVLIRIGVQQAWTCAISKRIYSLAGKWAGARYIGLIFDCVKKTQYIFIPSSQSPVPSPQSLRVIQESNRIAIYNFTVLYRFTLRLIKMASCSEKFGALLNKTNV